MKDKGRLSHLSKCSFTFVAVGNKVSFHRSARSGETFIPKWAWPVGDHLKGQLVGKVRPA